MKLSEYVKPHGMITQLSKETGVSAPNISYRCRQGWCIGVLNGQMVMYNPKQTTEMSNSHKPKFEEWSEENAES
ncbi:hypothetical protein VP137E351_P0038 [Vibrio phage 137E35-1]|nr:hypothetical protein VP137E351_P0038 [Vibrio phage 137E35-1]CAH9016171.1 hypothetical protein VP230E391_P0038 [Vibrio phage 230E39-1]